MSIKNKKSHLNKKKKKKKKEEEEEEEEGEGEGDMQRPGGLKKKKKGVKKNNEAHVQLHMGIFLLCLKPLY